MAGENQDPIDVRGGADEIFNLLGDEPDEFGDLEDEQNRAPDEEPDDEPEDDEDFEEEFEEDEFEGESDDEFDADEDADDDSDETPSSDDPQTLTVQVDGEEQEVTLDEARAGYMRQADYTRKTQQVAEERRAIKEEVEGLRTERSEYAERLRALEQVIEANSPEEPDWDALREEDPARFAQEFAAWQKRQQRLQALREEHQRVRAEQQAEFEEAYQEHIREEKRKLHLAVPEWQDQEKATADKKRMAEYAESEYGYTSEDLAQVSDHRLLLMLRKAMLYDQMSEKGKKVRKKAKKRKAKNLKPGSSGSRKKRKKKGSDARKRLRETGRVDDAAAALLETLPEDAF